MTGTSLYDFNGDVLQWSVYNTPMPKIYERNFRIRFYECDAYGHVNHANYLRFMQEAAIEASADVGYDSQHPGICGRCTSNLFGPGEQRNYA